MKEVMEEENYSYQFVDDDGRLIELDPNDKEFFSAFELVRSTKEITYITGKAGTGKTTLLKYIKKHVKKETAVVAFTGVASLNAGGQTINSFFKINPFEAPFLPNDNRLRFRVLPEDPDTTTLYNHFQYTAGRRATMEALEILIIDEISMVRVDMLHVIDRLLRAFSGKGRDLPFGGVQIVLIGDLFQLPPVEDDAWEILDNFYETPFFFSAPVLREISFKKIELKTIHRQDERTEKDFIGLLNRVRINEAEEGDVALLNARVADMTPEMFEEGFICLCSTRTPASNINSGQLETLETETYTYQADVQGNFPMGSYPTDLNLNLKVGAQVMLIKNGDGYVNGTIGKISSLTDDSILVKIKTRQGEHRDITIDQNRWENRRYFRNTETGQLEQEIIGTFKQYPIRLAWAITIHKSQGLTFDKIAVSIPFMDFFRPTGLVYVALSRCKSWNGLKLISPLDMDSIHVDSRIIEFGKQITPETLIEDAIQHGKANAHYLISRKFFSEGKIDDSIKELFVAMKFRNDLDSEEFKRFISVIGKRSHHLKHVFAEQLDKFESLNSLFEQQEERSVEREKLFEELNEKYSYSLDELLELNNLISELEYDKIEFQRRIDFLEDKKRKQNERILQLDSKVSVLSKKSLEDSIEIERLKNLSWFDKLFGAE